jgi:uncharacterized protein YgiM (DUF1202 family)
MKLRYVSVAIVLLLINYLIFASIFSFLMDYRGKSALPQANPKEILPTFTPAPAEPFVIIPTPTATPIVPTPTNTRVVNAEAMTPTPVKKTGSVSKASLVSTATINIRSGPGVKYEVVGQLNANVTMPIVGRTEDSSWWQIQLNNGSQGWVANNVVRVSQVENVPKTQP